MKKYIITSGARLFLARSEAGCLQLPSLDATRYPADADTFEFGDYMAIPADRLADEDRSRFVDMGVREAYGRIPAEDYAAVVKGVELVNWSSSERHCGKCGALLERATDICKRCAECGREYFPRLNPAIVVLVKKGEEALLVHARNFSRAGMMALVAGFVETGESLEECVRREVKEETDLDVGSIRYVGSQSWPFPHQLMLGFTAEYAGGEVRYADGELSAGRFFSREEAPELPTLPSLSRRIIDRWISGEL